MKLLTSMLILLLNISFQINTLFAYEHPLQAEIVHEKFCVNSSQVFIFENEIFVLMDNDWVRVDSLKNNVGNLLAYRGYWVCPRCNQRNALGNVDCSKCDYSLPYLK